MAVTLDDLRRFAVKRTMSAPTTLKRALSRMGFVPVSYTHLTLPTIYSV